MPRLHRKVMNSDDELKESLKAWKAEVELPARFQAEVWQRIAARADEQKQSWVLDWLLIFLPRPQYASALVAVMILFGFLGAQFQAQQDRAQTFQKLEARYVQSIDPYSQVALTSNE